MLQFSRVIWKTFEESAYERARYLRELYLTENADLRPTLYLDVGTHSGYNAVVFGKEANEIFAVDLKFPKNCKLKGHNKSSLVIADGQSLPFKGEIFDLISLFSVIEHVENQELLVKETCRVLKPTGKLIIQIPNKFFPLELHSGLPFVFVFPLRIRGFIFEKIGYGWLLSINIPSVKMLKKTIWKIVPHAKILVKKVIYPPKLVPPKLRSLYISLQKGLILRLVPLGFFFIVEKTSS